MRPTDNSCSLRQTKEKMREWTRLHCCVSLVEDYGWFVLERAVAIHTREAAELVWPGHFIELGAVFCKHPPEAGHYLHYQLVDEPHHRQDEEQQQVNCAVTVTAVGSVVVRCFMATESAAVAGARAAVGGVISFTLFFVVPR